MKTLSVITCGLLLFLLSPKPSLAANLDFSFGEYAISKDQVVPIELWVNTDNAKILAVDAYVTYDPAFISIVGVEDGPRMSVVSKDISNSKVLYIGAIKSLPKDEITGHIKLAAIKVRPKKIGTTHLAFRCTDNRTDDSNIVEDSIKAEDIINCEKNVGSLISIVQPTITPIQCTEPRTSGDFNCDQKVDLKDFEKWRQDFLEGKSTLKEFEIFREAFTSPGDVIQTGH